MTRSIDGLLRDALDRRAAAAPPTPCLDAETAAAFGDDTLPAHERAGIEAHVADCVRCQTLLAVFARTMPPAAARAWWRRPAIAWLAPLAVAAMGLVVWINVPRRSTMEPPIQQSREAARKVQSDSIPPPAAAVEPRPQALRDVKASPAPPAPLLKRERDRSMPSKDVAAAKPSNAIADNLVAAPQAGAAPAPPPEHRMADAQLPSTPVPPAAMPQSEATRPSSVAETATVTSNASGRILARGFNPAREPIIFSSNPISRWRVGTGGVVQHSADGGSTWQTQTTGVNVTLTAGSSPSPSVCWLVGPAGVVLITMDEGRSWEGVTFPVETDLVSVRATDDKTATVVTSDGRTFTTSDRGRTWTR
jgi:hypothetical protein